MHSEVLNRCCSLPDQTATNTVTLIYLDFEITILNHTLKPYMVREDSVPHVS